MPSSSDKGKDAIKYWLNCISPKTILDVGPGEGTYSKRFRLRGQTWDAIEIFKPYVNKFGLNQLYNHVYIADMLAYPIGTKYDAVIFGDVLEHVTNYDAVCALVKYLRWCNYAIISLPLDAETHAPSGTGDIDWGNVHELHRGHWSDLHFQDVLSKAGIKLVDTKKYPEIAVYLVKATPQILNVDDIQHLLPRQETLITQQEQRSLWLRRTIYRMTIIGHSIKSLLFY